MSTEMMGFRNKRLSSCENKVGFGVKNLAKAGAIIALAIAGSSLSMTAQAEGDAFTTALLGGKIDFMARYRWEHVDDESNTLDEAYGQTVRVAMGYKTGSFHGLRLYGQFEGVMGIQEDYWDGGAQGGTARNDTIVDPEGVEMNQGYISYEGFDNTLIKYGRQIITPRKAPFHRYLGTVLWRQNWQTHDAVTVTNTSLPNTKILAGYIYDVERIFGNRHPTNDHEAMDSFIFNVQYSGFSLANIEAYAYLLDYDTPNFFNVSTQTYGIRASGKYGINDKTKLLYTAEYADQSDYESTMDFSNSYYLGEIGLNYKVGSVIDSVTLKFSYEVLEGDVTGGSRFHTPLATGHAFQGWADRFLVTPVAGIEDAYVTFVAKVYGAKFVAVYHDLSAEDASYDYGTEIDLLLAKTFKKKFTVGVKYSDYDGDTNAGNGGALDDDTSKTWIFAQYKY